MASGIITGIGLAGILTAGFLLGEEVYDFRLGGEFDIVDMAVPTAITAVGYSMFRLGTSGYGVTSAKNISTLAFLAGGAYLYSMAEWMDPTSWPVTDVNDYLTDKAIEGIEHITGGN